ncbi:uncharacterized protein LOC113209743 [Frankliniella occidentalis]|uniref:Uncharacterized protein LOC113209743 n=1 Tax=Frankliniella occidentalis TaxID=133901 RepID=A0A9C6UBG7_FRAOC|nr:uncharacterized protein LOC113209743 [Frankliniella occidentalis]
MPTAVPTFTLKVKDKPTKILVTKPTIDDIINRAIERLEVEPGEFKLVLDNGAILEDDEVLTHLPPLTELTLVPKTGEWMDTNENVINVTPNITVASQRHSSPSVSTPRLSNARGNFPWRVLDDFKEHLESGCIDLRQRKSILHNLAAHMSARNDFSRKTCVSLTNDLFEKYPKPFEIRDADGDLLSDGKASFFNSLYERVNFIKPQAKKNKRKRNEAEDEDEDDPKWPHICNDKLDSYGCAAWQPHLPANENEATLERLRTQLADTSSETELLELLEKSYWLQRHQINFRKGDIHSVLSKWPALQSPNPFQAHSTMLLGKDVRTLWAGSHNRLLSLYNFLADYCTSTNQTSSNRETLSEIKVVREEAEASSRLMDSRKPFLIAAFIMLVQYLKEDLNCLFKLVDCGTNVEEVKPMAEVDRPLLIIRGQSWFDSNCMCFIACEGDIITSTNNALEAFKLLFLSYYNFNYHYPEKGRRFLEYMQRAIFKINPVQGTRKAPGDKRRATNSVDPMVKKTIAKVDSFYVKMMNMTRMHVMDDS